MSVCTFLPQLAETPVEQSQDKANEYGLERLQYGWLEGKEGGRRGIRRNQPANQPKPTWRMEQLQWGGEDGGRQRETDRGRICGLVSSQPFLQSNTAISTHSAASIHQTPPVTRQHFPVGCQVSDCAPGSPGGVWTSCWLTALCNGQCEMVAVEKETFLK